MLGRGLLSRRFIIIFFEVSIRNISNSSTTTATAQFLETAA
jgi:hypothetical protein